MTQQPDPAIVQDLQRKFTGLGDKLKFQPGHTICNKYDAYKTAAESAKFASTTYKTTAAGLKAIKPYAEPAYNAGGTAYHSSGHRILDPLAGNASTTAEFHADRRDSFNTKYKEILSAKGQLRGHLRQADEAHKSANKYNYLQTKHQYFGAHP